MKKRDGKMNNHKKITIIGLLLAVTGVILLGLYVNVVSHPFEEFKGPNYLPATYNNSENLTDDNERIFEYKGNGTFYSMVVKDPNNLRLKNITNIFEEDPESVNHTSENIIVNGHNVVFEVSEMSLPQFGISLAKFQASWYCDKTHLTYKTMGMVTSDQKDEMKKMIMSVVCHENSPHIYL
jgi:hypothetical protein